MTYQEMTREQLKKELKSLKNEYAAKKALGLSLDMSRGKPSAEQLDLSMGMLDVLSSSDNLVTRSGIDVRNYGQLAGIPEARALFADLMGIEPDEVFICGNSKIGRAHV